MHIHLVLHSSAREGSDRVTDRGSTAGRNLEVHSIDDVEYCTGAPAFPRYPSSIGARVEEGSPYRHNLAMLSTESCKTSFQPHSWTEDPVTMRY